MIKLDVQEYCHGCANFTADVKEPEKYYAGGKVYGAHLTAAEKKAMDIEIRRQLAEYDLKHANELDAMILWHLHEEFDFGPKRLKQFYDTFAVRLDELIKHYEMTDSDMVWLCTYKLKQYGIDIEEWNKQRRD